MLNLSPIRQHRVALLSRWPLCFLTVGLLLSLLLLGSAQARPLADPIVGTWGFAHGTVRVTAAGSGYVGTVTVPLVFEGPVPGPNGAGDGDCMHPVGEQIWPTMKLSTSYVPVKNRRVYEGKAQVWNGTPCSLTGYLPGVTLQLWTRPGGRQELKYCGIETQNFPGGCASAFGPAKPKKPAGPAGRVSFNFNHNSGTSFGGGPNLGSGYKETYSQGELTFKGAEVTGQKGAFLFGYEFSNGDELDVNLKALGVVGKPDLSGPVKSVVFRIAVESSKLPGCASGQRGKLSLWDNGPKPDKITLTLCGRTRTYADDNPKKDRLYVQIKPQ